MKTFIVSFSFLFFYFSPSTYPQWYQQYSGVNTNLYSFFSIDGQTAWATGANGVILKTTNSGASWVQKPSGTSYSISFVHFFNPNEGIVAGSGGTIKKSYDGGNTWQSVYGGTYNRLQEGCFINDSVGYLCGDAGVIIKTTNRGNSWSASVVTPNNICFIDFVNESTGFISTETGGQVWKTTDAGASWTLKLTVGNIGLWQIHFANENNGWFVGEFGTIGKTTDGGETWFGQFSGTNVNLRSVYFHTPEIGWVVGKDETRLRTTNGGSNWLLEHTGYDYEFLYIYFFNESIGWIIGTPGWWTGYPAVILYTDNGGVPVELTSFTVNVNDREQVEVKWSTATEINNSGFEVQRLFLNHQGTDWEASGFVPGHGTTTEPQYYSFLDQIVQSGKYKYRLKQIDYDGTSEYSEEVEVDVNNSIAFTLEQNFPNPFNPSTKIQYSIPERENVRLIVYNGVGEEVSVLVDGIVEAGQYEVTFDAANLPSGIYLYKLQSDRGIEVKKMILLK